MKKLPLLKRAKKSNISLLSDLKSRHVFACLLFGFFTVSLLSACGPASQVKANLGSQFSLAVNQTAIIAGEDLQIKFVEINDSRCPKGAQCIWAGEGRAAILINGTDNLTLVQPGYSTNNTETYRNYTFRFQVAPYPVVDKPILKGDYRLVMTLTK